MEFKVLAECDLPIEDINSLIEKNYPEMRRLYNTNLFASCDLSEVTRLLEENQQRINTILACSSSEPQTQSPNVKTLKETLGCERIRQIMETCSAHNIDPFEVLALGGTFRSVVNWQ